MNTYACDWIDPDGIAYCVSFDAKNWEQAERIAARKGWNLLGQCVDEVPCPAEVEAMIELHLARPVVH